MVISTSLLLIMTSIISLAWKGCLCLKPAGYELIDLNTTGSDFNAQASQWTNTGLYSGAGIFGTTSNVFTCEDTSLVGGYNVLNSYDGSYFQRIYTNLPPHNMIYFSFDFWIFDDWNLIDTFDIVFDSIRITGWQFVESDFPIEQFNCGNSGFLDLPNVIIVGRTPHNSDSLILQIISHTNDDVWNESFGFRDVNLLFLNRSEVEPAEACGKSSISLRAKECPCEAEVYLEFSSDATCANCSAHCASCFGPNPEDCFICMDGYSYIDQQCTECYPGCTACHGTGPEECDTCEIDKFLAWDNSCFDTCDFPLTSVTLADGYQGCVYPCNSSDHLYWNGSCFSSCESPLIPKGEAGALFCDFPCGSTEFLFLNEYCIPTCDPPFSQYVDGVAQYCYSSCSEGFLYWDGLCSSSCPSPMSPGAYTSTTTTEVIKVCEFLCLSTDYIQWDGSCWHDCPSPLVSNTYRSQNFCNYPCESTDDFIYWNNTCYSTCPSPYIPRIEERGNFCDLPCSEEEFLFPDGSCQNTCESPLSITEMDGIKFCEDSCDSQEYLFWDGSCLAACDLPLLINNDNGNLLCVLPCSSPYEYHYEETGSCSAECIAPNTIKVYNLYIACGPSETIQVTDPDDLPDDSPSPNPLTNAESSTGTVMNTAILVDTIMAVPSEPMTLVLILLVKILQYIRYLDVAYPPKLQKMLIKKSNSLFVLNFGPSISSQIKSAFEHSSIPPVFERYNLDSSFLVDFWQVMTTLSIVFALICLVIICEKTINRFKLRSFYVVIGLIKVILKWNFIIIIFICNINEVILYSSLELQTFNIKFSLEVLSLIGCILMLITIPTLMIGSFYLSRLTQQKREKALEDHSQIIYITHEMKWQGLQVLWSGFKVDTFMKQNFISICIARITAIYLLASNLYTHPLLQAILYFVISVIFLAYLVHQKPLTKKTNQIQLYIYESIILMVNLCIILLAILDASSATAEQLRIFVGDIIIFCHLALNLTAASFLGIKIAMRVENMYNLYKKNHRCGKKGCFHLFILPLQQMAMGFEQIRYLQALDRQIQIFPISQKEAAPESGHPRIMSSFTLPVSDLKNPDSSRKRLSITLTSSSASPLMKDFSGRKHLKPPSIIIKHLSLDHFNRKMSLSEPNPEDPEDLITEDELLQKKKLYESSDSIPPESPEKGSSSSSQKIDSNKHSNKEVNSNSPDLSPRGVMPQNSPEIQRLSPPKNSPKQSEKMPNIVDMPSQRELPLIKERISLKIIKADKIKKRLPMLNITEKLEEVDSYLESSFNQQGGKREIAYSRRLKKNNVVKSD